MIVLIFQMSHSWLQRLGPRERKVRESPQRFRLPNCQSIQVAETPADHQFGDRERVTESGSV